MNISKADFKIIFHKMVNSDNNTVNKYIKNLEINGITGEQNIDKIIKNYNPGYILKVMNKINKKVLTGGEDATSQEEKKEDNKISSINIVDNVSGTISSIPVEKTVDVVSSEVNTPKVVSDVDLSAASSDMTKVADNNLSTTSSEMPVEVPKVEAELSATSSEMPPVVKESEQIFIKSESVTSSEVPDVIASENMSSTSSVFPGIMTSTSTEIPEPVSKSEIAEIFVSEKNAEAKPEVKKQEPTIKVAAKELIEKLKVKSKLLNDKEAELKAKESELDNRQKIIVQLEEDGRRKLDEVNKQLEDLRKEKEDLTNQVNGLKNESDKLKDSLSEIEVNTNDILLTDTESKPVSSILSKLFGN